MNLFLASSGLGALGDWLSGPAVSIRTVAFVDVAARPLHSAPFVESCAQALQLAGCTVVPLDVLSGTRASVETALEASDAVFVTGGYVRYLLQHATRSGFADAVRQLVPEGLAYLGVSAGAVLAGPDIAPNVGSDDPGVTTVTEGLGLVDFVVLPHVGRHPAAHHEAIERRFEGRWPLVRLRDDEAIIVNSETWDLVPSA